MLKKFIGSDSWKSKGVLALGLLVSSGAWAAPVPLLSNPLCVECTIDTTPGAGGGWTIDDGGFGFPAGTWTKFLPSVGAILFGGTVTLTEDLTLLSPPGSPPAPGNTLNSWTETILGTDWVWGDGTFDTIGLGVNDVHSVGSPTGGPTITFGPLGLDTAGTGVGGGAGGDIAFEIVKTLRCINAADGCTQGLFVRENAAPEPGTLLLLAGGLAGLAGLRRRRYS